MNINLFRPSRHGLRASVLGIAIAFAGVGSARADLPPSVHDGVWATLNGYVDVYLAQDMDAAQKADAALEFFAPDATTTILGTQEHELGVGLDEIHAILLAAFSGSSPEIVAIRYNPIAMDAQGDIAWVTTYVDSDVVVDGGIQTVSIRFTAVLRKVGGKWLFTQFHDSLPFQFN